MGELVHSDSEVPLMSVPESSDTSSADIIDFSRASSELVMGAFLYDLQASIDKGENGIELAHRIKTELSPEPGSERSELQDRLVRLVGSADAFADNELYDHKADHDPVFQRLITVLQATKQQQHSLHEHRQAALKLAELRAIMTDDETPHDDLWQSVIDRLFT